PYPGGGGGAGQLRAVARADGGATRRAAGGPAGAGRAGRSGRPVAGEPLPALDPRSLAGRGGCRARPGGGGHGSDRRAGGETLAPAAARLELLVTARRLGRRAPPRGNTPASGTGAPLPGAGAPIL